MKIGLYTLLLGFFLMNTHIASASNMVKNPHDNAYDYSFHTLIGDQSFAHWMIVMDFPNRLENT
ncbi:MAG: hypothetical protein Q8R79_06030 [Legionellaceae bacterium]|nr:hypothetical protein [Legionellaceae bacterium]